MDRQVDAPPVRVAELWRYPVKSLAGELLESADLMASGIRGDRVVHVRKGRDGRVITARTHPRLLSLRATLGEDGEPLINGEPWASPAAAAAVRGAAGDYAQLTRYDGLERFDVLPLLVATDGALALLGADRRRLRPNIVLAGVDSLDERTWVGRRLRLGEAMIAVASVRRRCVMTTYDPQTQVQDRAVLQRIVTQFDGRIALDCAVVRGGHIVVGDQVTLL